MKRLAVLWLAFVLVACAVAPPTPAPLEIQLQALKERLLVLVEAERHRLNEVSRPLIQDPDLMRAAQAHSDDMAAKRSFDTGNPDGNVAVNRLLGDPRFHGYVAENVAAQYFTPGQKLDPDRYARGFLEIWLNSTEHRNTLADARFEKAGVGLAAGGNLIFAATLFAKDFGLPGPP